MPGGTATTAYSASIRFGFQLARAVPIPSIGHRYVWWQGGSLDVDLRDVLTNMGQRHRRLGRVLLEAVVHYEEAL